MARLLREGREDGEPRRDAPSRRCRGDEEGRLTPDQELALYEYYGMGYPPSGGQAQPGPEPEDRGGGRHLASEPTTGRE
jgi:hypothetical protein